MKEMIPLSLRQRKAFVWWARREYEDYAAIICDGAIRSGKTLAMGMGFFFWAMACFSDRQFALCGRSVGALRRNLLETVLPQLRRLGFACEDFGDGTILVREVPADIDPADTAATLEELVMSAEYIMAEGNPNVVLCERGIRTFETSMRNTLDISAVPMLKKMTHLPVVIDPSHAAGIAFMVPSLAKAAVAVGADGLMIEVHNDPARAKSDGAQSLTPDQFDDLMATIRPELEFFGKTLN